MRLPLVKAHGAIYLRCYTTVRLDRQGKEVNVTEQGSVVVESGRPKRKKFAFRLGRIPEGMGRFPVSTILRNNPALTQELSHIQGAIRNAEERLGAGKDEPSGGRDLTVAEFFETVYLPYVEETKAPATIKGIKQYWGGYLKTHFGQTLLREYRVETGTNYLEELCKEFSQNTVNHVRSLAKSIFGYAIAKGYFRGLNQWDGVKQTAKAQKVEDPVAYTLAQVKQFDAALEKFCQHEFFRESAQMALYLAYFGGLRPEEIAGLAWADVADEKMKIHQAYSGHLRETKNGKVRFVRLVPQLRNRLKLWRTKRPAGEWVIPNMSGRNIDMAELGNTFVKQAARKAGLDWSGWYAARRGFGTAMAHAHASSEKIAQAMGNSPTIAWKHYIKDIEESKMAADAIDLWAAQLANGNNVLSQDHGQAERLLEE
jgi:integrase